MRTASVRPASPFAVNFTRHALLALLALLGCESGGGAHESTVPSLGGSGSLDAFFAALVDGQCDWLLRCSPYGGIAPALCADLRDNLAPIRGPQLQAAVDAGRLVYRPEAGEACLANVGQDCTLAADPGDVCRDALVGVMGAGEPCELNIECAEGTFCDQGVACPGVCRPQVDPNGICEVTAQCPDPQVCLHGRCVPPASAGQRCDAPDHPDCRTGLHCAPDSRDGAPTCKPPEAILSEAGGACAPDQGLYCAGALVCQFDRVEAGVAVFGCGTPVGEGAACTYSIPDACPVGWFCDQLNPMGGDVDGRCAPLPTAGEPCALPRLWPARRCAPGTLCDAQERCAAPKALGEPCTDAPDCASGACSAGLCAVAPACEP